MTDPLHALLRPSPAVLVDVGARGGLPPLWQPLADVLTWVAFEPDARSRDALEPTGGGRRIVLATALADRARSVTFHGTRDAGDSSILRPNAPFLNHFANPERFDVVTTTEMDADTLDAQLQRAGIPRIDFLKLDTQGSERLILEGARALLATGILGVDIEVEFSPMYEEQPLFADVDALLRQFDLQLFDLAPRRWPYSAGAALTLGRGPVVWAEALYFRTLDALARDLDALDTGAARDAHASKAVAFALLYGFPDYAAAIAQRLAPSLSEAHRAALDAAIREWDADAAEPAVPLAVSLSPGERRQLLRIQAETGLKPTAQIRKAVKAWLKAHPRPDA